MQRQSMRWLVILTVLILLFTVGCARKQEEGQEDQNQAQQQEEQQEEQGREDEGAAEEPTGKILTGMVTDVGGLGDQSFNDAAYAGLQRAKEELGAEIKVVESNEMTAYVSNLSSLGEQKYDLVWAIGVLMSDALIEVAENQPDTQFGIVDGVVDKPNVFSATFKEEEGSFLAGVVAGMMTKSNKVGFIGGMDIPSIRKFEAGYRAGMKAANPKAQLIYTYAGAFDDPNKGKEAALAQIGQGVDVIYHAAGSTGVGVIKAAAEKKKYAIGVDQPQSHLAPDYILTSMIKRVDLAVYEGIKALDEGNFPSGQHKIYSLKEDGVGLDLEQLKKMTPQEVQDKVAQMREKIINGEIQVPTTREESEKFTL